MGQNMKKMPATFLICLALMFAVPEEANAVFMSENNL